MKIRVDINPAKEEEIVIHAHTMNKEVENIRRILDGLDRQSGTLLVYSDTVECYLPISNVLFCESDDTLSGSQSVAVHTANKVYGSTNKLYELEQMLPGEFMRVSKSTIANVSRVFSVHHNVTSASLVTFADSHKQIYVSRSYYKAFKALLTQLN